MTDRKRSDSGEPKALATERTFATADPGADLAIDEIGIAPPRLEKMVEPTALADTAASLALLGGVEVRVFSTAGLRLAGPPLDAASAPLMEPAFAGLRAATEMSALDGSRYRLLPIVYDRKPIGAVVVGPFVSNDGTAEVPQTPPGNAKVVDPDTLDRLSVHVTQVLDLVVWSGHKAFLTSTMHLASMRESYRELQVKNAKLTEAYDRLKELDRLKSNFIATVSHELRTPLTSIMGYAEMLAEGIAGPLSQEQHDFIATIRTKSDQLLALIVSLLDMSKLESGTFFVRPSEVVIGDVLADVIATLTPTATKKGVVLRYERLAPSDPVLPRIAGDADRLRQVFLNLTENAIKFTPAGGSVTLSAGEGVHPDDDDDALVLVAPVKRAIDVRVADTGVGIPPHERDRVFAPFYQVDQSSTREQGGTGLGLAIVKRLVDAHHGSIRIEDNTPRGTQFVVTLPCVSDASSKPPIAPPSDSDRPSDLPAVFS